mmetsp:Transcript_14634/g.30028  ORF Transcript_14634/g.30028 Transcript_14634/m.30028 type:complete len:164 (+) Transcript_14634:550-1041(+)
MFYVTYVLPTIVCLVDTDNFMLWTGMKGIFGGLNLSISTVLVYRTSNVILAACKSLPEDKQAALKAKFKRCVRAGATIAFVLLFTGFLDLMAEGEYRKLTVGSGFGGFILWLIFRVIFTGGLGVIYVTNKTSDKRKNKGGKVAPKSSAYSSKKNSTAMTSQSE